MNNQQVSTHRLWAQQLHLEFADIIWKYKLNLQPPVIEISRSKTLFGFWDPKCRTIGMSACLITHFSWAVTLEVFKHEIAHQVCSEILHSQEVAHGRAFQNVCETLGVSQAFRSSKGDASPQVAAATNGNELTQAGRRFLQRVEKLLALAGSSNQHEATLAMQKANVIIEKYNIVRLMETERSEFTYTIINRKKKQIAAYQRRICSILIEFFQVKVVVAQLYDPLSHETHRTIELFGAQEHVTIAEYCYYFLENRLSSLWDKLKVTGGNARRRKKSYYLGILDGFYEKLLLQRKGENFKPSRIMDEDIQRLEKLTTLIKVEAEELKLFVKKRYPRLSKVTRRSAPVCPEVYKKGIQAGAEITLSKALVSSNNKCGGMISE